MDSSPRKKLHYGWLVFIACFFMVLFALGFCSSPKSLYLSAITADMGLKRTAYSITDSCRYVISAVMNLTFGFIIVKLGARRMVSFCFIALVASLLISSFATTLPAFYLGGALLGLGLAGTTTSMVGYIIEKWFTKGKGTIMGIILGANGLGGAVSAQVLSKIINSSSSGWRTSYRVTAVIITIIGIAVVLVIRNDPSEKGLEPLGQDKVAKAARGVQWDGISLGEAVRRPFFYITLVCLFCFGMTLQSIQAVSSALMKDVGFSAAVVANTLSIHSVCLAGAKMGVGTLFDKAGLRVSLIFCNVCAVIACLCLTAMNTAYPALPYIYCVISAFAIPIQTVMLPLITKELFGKKDYAKIMGICVATMAAGYSVGTPALNAVYDALGNYRAALIASAVISAVAAAGVQFAISLSRKSTGAK